MNKRKHNPIKHEYNSSILSQFPNLEPGPNTVGREPSTSSMVENHDTDPLLTDDKGRRIIIRNSLYEDPDLFNFSQESSHKFERLQGWLRSGEDSYTIENEVQNEICSKQNKIQRELNKMLVKTVQVTKAERIMEKMGWQGGSLGKHGDGIIEPIAPNAAYATKTVGLGQTAKRKKIINTQDKKDEDKEYFYTNVLFHILEFVKNDLETEIAFDCRLCKRERKWVHNIVEALTNDEKAANTDFDTMVQIEIAQEIFKFNNYILATESEGVFPNRSLCLYKEAPETMFLVTPDDLKEEQDVETEVDNSKQCKKQSNISNNSVVANISEIEKDPNSLANDLLTTITGYFTEFVEDDNYNEFRFLGPFSSEEINAINIFVDKCTKNDFQDSDVLKDVFNNNIIEIKENCNGNIIFCRSNKNE